MLGKDLEWSRKQRSAKVAANRNSRDRARNREERKRQERESMSGSGSRASGQKRVSRSVHTASQPASDAAHLLLLVCLMTSTPKNPASPSSPSPIISLAKRGAQDPLYAYGLSALFWASVPASFLSAHSDARSPRLASSSGHAAAAKSPLAKALDAHSLDTVKTAGQKVASPKTILRGGLAPFWQLAGIGSLIGLGGYISSQGDPLNGAGTVTGEHCLSIALPMFAY